MRWRRRQPSVTVCVPVHDGAAFVADTLASIAAQTHRDLVVLVADDGSTDGSPEVVRPFLRDRRFRLEVRPTRLGWVDSCNRLLEAASTEYVCIAPHDDLLAPTYVERLLARLAADPACVLAFCDIQVFGLEDKVLVHDSVVGTTFERARQFIAEHEAGTAFRGLLRRRALDTAGFLRHNPTDDFAADLTWLARLAHVGELHRVPEVLYRKQRRAGSASLRWGDWNDDEKAAAWCMHCAELLRDALTLDLTAEQRAEMERAAERRLLQVDPPLPFPFIRDLPDERKAALVARFRSLASASPPDAAAGAGHALA